ncbi:MAG: sigma-54-dependent Fis family transcriptional regulator [Candidatus Riflebacteria bacterium]|nr:sigma-54-dependent Fis family transcriptional regulator [Candidatus Riflebacteria bacterium]
MTLSVLVVEDDTNYTYEMKDELVRPAADLAEFHYASTYQEAIRKIDRLHPNLILLDIIFPMTPEDAQADRLDYEAGVRLLEHVSRQSPGSRTIVLSSQTKTFAVNLLIRFKEVADYIFKDAPWPEIRVKVLRQLESLAKLQEMSTKLLSRYRLIGRSEAMCAVRKLIERVAPRGSTTVLIQGESGTGKELVARNLHQQSPRNSGPFVVVNCGAIPEGLLESEFFGHVRGSFTGAVRDVRGKFEQADGGTLFLDEIGEIPLALQSKLLRAIQDREFTRVGDELSRQSDARVVAATNRDLAAEVKAGRFREDLFYRLNVFPIHVPALRTHPEDVPELAVYYSDIFNREMQEGKQFSPEAIALLTAYDWPGNVRELKNIVERLFIISDSNVIDAAAVELLLQVSGEGYQVNFPLAETSYKKAKSSVVRLFHRRFLLHHLRRNGFNVSRTAAEIGYNRQDLGKLVAELGLDREKE